ncbi:hypothetical protein CY34DRAFT_799315 [Suillus luteus UH-Slu-Lm8-n1]|uniref:Uncharacterized protein n=1 Tax=Suillus luteus UH-Slu-Lm8-n1 TaxID=930992 RepID=A0A0D0BC61_9AGAM|nr:hypothetical protein CY34DRAFT_799315 [Suillus luteus UH-Slu-Lm8-n1]
MDEYSSSMVGANKLNNLVLVDITVQNPRILALIVSPTFPKVKVEAVVFIRHSFDYKRH